VVLYRASRDFFPWPDRFGPIAFLATTIKHLARTRKGKLREKAGKDPIKKPSKKGRYAARPG
jgi:hypothetical protein